ncbi:hypothetical protein Tco_1426016, partial [Tanacetum coccineum]
VLICELADPECRYKRADTTDVILLDNIDESNKWLMGKMDGEEASEPAYSTKASTSTTVAHVQSRKARSQKGKSATHASTFSSKGKEHLFDEDGEMEMDIGLSQDHEVNEVLQIHDDQVKSDYACF